MSIVKVVLVTKQQAFPAGTVDSGVFTYTLEKDGVVIATQSDAGLTVSFQAVDPGTYVAKVVKNGVEASAPVVVPDTSVMLAVPDTITVAIE